MPLRHEKFEVLKTNYFIRNNKNCQIKTIMPFSTETSLCKFKQ